MREIKPAKGEYIYKIATTHEDVIHALNEINIWDDCDWIEREILAPIVNVDMNNYSDYVITTMPKFYPLFTAEEASQISNDEAFVELQRKMLTYGYDDEQIGVFLSKVTDFCVDYNIDMEELLGDLSNIGYNPSFGVRIIDYGKVNV